MQKSMVDDWVLRERDWGNSNDSYNDALITPSYLYIQKATYAFNSNHLHMAQINIRIFDKMAGSRQIEIT